MRLIFLGTGGYHPNERRHTASLLLPDIGLALDAGSGFFRVQSRLASDSLDVFLTHAHLDHICGLTYFLVPVLTGTVKSVRIHGTARTLKAARRHLFAAELFPVDPPYEWIPLPENGIVPIHDAVVTWIGLEHPGGCIGYRIDWPDRSMAYITDTTAPGEYGTFIQNVDVLVHECYFPDEQQDWAVRTGHSSATAVAEVARTANAGRLYLVHTDPQQSGDDPVGLEKIQAIFPNAQLAEDLQEIEF
ncbi:MAG: MBL fold metallo-hydrolase [Planctomycetaceae bacterium]